jgi:hypothetical protein
MQSEIIHRHDGGSIDHDFYRKGAARLRAETLLTFCPGKRNSGRTLFATAMTLAPAGALIILFLAMAGFVHVLNGGASTVLAINAPGLAEHAR